jgi:hypothetical protein
MGTDEGREREDGEERAEEGLSALNLSFLLARRKRAVTLVISR